MHRALLALPLLCFTAAAQPPAATPFKARFRDEVTCPSLTSRYVLQLDFGDWPGIWSGFPKADWKPVKTADLAADPASYRFVSPFRDPTRYYVRRGDSERVPVERVDFARCAETDAFCETGGPDYSVVYLVLNPTQLRAQDKVTVFLIPPGQTAGPQPDKDPASNAVTLPKPSQFQFGLTPGFVPNQEVANGRKRSVGHLDTTLNIDRIGLWGGFARSYVRTSGTISTDAKDKSSQVEARWMVMERALPLSWYLPFQIESKLLGNQVVSNLSWVSSAGISGLIPWRWTRNALYGEFLQIPVSPIWKLSAQNEYRARQTAAAALKFPDRDTFRLFGEMAWSPIRLLPGPGSEVLSLELLGRGWYFPSDRNSQGQTISRLEGLFEVSLLLPVTKLQFSGYALVNAEKSKPKQRVRVKYSLGANEANAFQHSSTLSLGVEMVK